MRKQSALRRDIGIVVRTIWFNLFLFATILTGAAALMRLSGAYPQSNWLDLFVNAYHMATGERVTTGGDGIVPVVFTFVLPVLTVIVLGEGALRVASSFIARSKHREEWDRMVAKTFSKHTVVCGVGELGRALVRHLLEENPTMRMVLVDPRPGILSELEVNYPNICHIQMDMTNIETLREANCQKADLIVISSGSDTYNLEAASKAMRLNPRAEIWVRLYRSDLVNLLDIEKKPNIHFFCPYQSAAQALVEHLKSTLHEPAKSSHLPAR